MAATPTPPAQIVSHDALTKFFASSAFVGFILQLFNLPATTGTVTHDTALASTAAVVLTYVFAWLHSKGVKV